jgi:hypothetical protein
MFSFYIFVLRKNRLLFSRADEAITYSLPLYAAAAGAMTLASEALFFIALNFLLPVFSRNVSEEPLLAAGPTSMNPFGAGTTTPVLSVTQTTV